MSLRSRRFGSCISKHSIISIVVVVFARTRLCRVNQFFGSLLSTLDGETFDILFIFVCGFVVGFLL
jgi:hypothetical protein